jgi:choline dehydrogenase-like flavoprotein
MTKRLPAKDVVVIGLGWTGSILAYELAEAGLDVVAIERGPWRDTATNFPISYAPDELRYRLHHELFLRPAQVSLTYRNNAEQTALPVRTWGAFMLGNGVGGGGVHWNAETWRFLPTDFTVRSHLTQRYGVNFLPADMTIQDWGVTYDELEPHYDRFEYLCGTSGTAGNLRGAIQDGGNPFSIEDILPYLKTGHNQTAAASGPMSEAVSASSARITDADLHAIAVYLKDQPGQGHEDDAPATVDDAVMKMGAAIYADECSACHSQKGTGISELFPALRGSPSVQSEEPTSLIHVILQGARSTATDGAPTAPAMPAFSWLLSDREVAAVATLCSQCLGQHGTGGQRRAGRRRAQGAARAQRLTGHLSGAGSVRRTADRCTRRHPIAAEPTPKSGVSQAKGGLSHLETPSRNAVDPASNRPGAGIAASCQSASLSLTKVTAGYNQRERLK